MRWRTQSIMGMVLLLQLSDLSYAQEISSVELQDTARIRSTIEAIGVFVDFGEFESICQLYDDVSVSDYSSLWGNEPTSGSPSNRATGWSGFIPGFDVTRHQISVTMVSVDGSSANASARVVADHWLDQQQWTISGIYDVVLNKKQGRWLISNWKFTLNNEIGSRELVDQAEVLAETLAERPIRCKRD